MIEEIPQLNNFELIKSNLKKQIEMAQSEVLTLEELQTIEQKINNLENLYFDKKVSEEDFKKEIGQLYFERNRAGIVNLSTLSEFHEALKLCNIDDETIKKVLAHENAHSSMAESLEVENNYKIRFVELADGRIGFIPSVEFGYPLNATPEQKREINQKITNAPEILSNRDKQRLDIEVSKDEPDIFQK